MAGFILHRRWAVSLTAFLAGALAALAMPGHFLIPLLFAAFPIFLWLIVAAPTRRAAFWRGWWFGFGHFVVGLYWIGNAVLDPSVEAAWAWPFAVAGLPALLSVFVGIAALLAFELNRRGWRPIPSLAVAWVVGELMRGYLLTGFPWNLMGSVWAVSDAAAQSAWVIGTYGLSLVTVLAATSPYALLRAPWRSWRAWGPLAASLLLIAGMTGFGIWRLATHPTVFDPDVKIRIVQASIPQSDKWKRSELDDNFLTYLRLSGLSAKDVSVFIWPETALPYFIADEPARQTLIGRFLPEGSALITGAPRIERVDGKVTKLWNSLFLLNSAGRIDGQYDKMHLVPFGEYLPLRPLLGAFGLDKLVFGDLDYSPGKVRPALSTPGIPPFWPLICYEIIFPGQVEGAGDRPGWLVNITNDAWYGDTSGPRQHLAAAKMRAIEEGLPVARAAGNGISAIFDGNGRLLGDLGYNRRGTVDSFLPKPVKEGLFAATGNWTLSVIILCLLLVSRRQRFPF